jgi:transcriptional regulator with XRE-family HTH domain
MAIQEKVDQRKLNKEEFAKLVGEKIKYYRNESGLTLRGIARRTEYTAGYIGLLEKGEAVPNSYVLVQLADVMGIPINYLLGQDDINHEKNKLQDPVLTNPKNEEYINVMKYLISKGISPEKIKQAIEFVEGMNN